MAGRGSRLRPHSLTVPKPMLPVAGSPIVAQLVNEIARVVDQPIDEVAYILGDPAFFGPTIEEELKQVAKDLGAKATIYPDALQVESSQEANSVRFEGSHHFQ